MEKVIPDVRPISMLRPGHAWRHHDDDQSKNRQNVPQSVALTCCGDLLQIVHDTPLKNSWWAQTSELATWPLQQITESRPAHQTLAVGEKKTSGLKMTQSELRPLPSDVQTSNLLQDKLKTGNSLVNTKVLDRNISLASPNSRLCSISGEKLEGGAGEAGCGKDTAS